MKKVLYFWIAAAVLIGGGAFFGGVKYGESKISGPQSGSLNRQTFQGSAANGFSNRKNANGNGMIAGEIIAKDGKSITVKLPDNGSKIVFYSSSTEIGKFTGGAANDLEIGKSVAINGKANSDGSVTAQSIQLRPQPTPTP
jgi:hypothetical protein